MQTHGGYGKPTEWQLFHKFHFQERPFHKQDMCIVTQREGMSRETPYVSHQLGTGVGDLQQRSKRLHQRYPNWLGEQRQNTRGDKSKGRSEGADAPWRGYRRSDGHVTVD